ncbi:MAG: hypothetical protein Q9210_001656 [Variospora velana]
MLINQGGFSVTGEGTSPAEDIDITLEIANHRIFHDEGYRNLTLAYAGVKNVAVKQSLTSPEYQASINPADVIGENYGHDLRDWLTNVVVISESQQSLTFLGKQTSLDAIAFVKDQD